MGNSILMEREIAETGQKIRCPRCKETALYRYGRTAGNRQRYLCLSCRRQFTPESSRSSEQRPECPVCRNTMHIYKTEKLAVRYRCSRYPECATYIKKSED